MASFCLNTRVLHSVLDIVCDIILFFDYLLGREDITEFVSFNDTTAVEDQINRFLGNPVLHNYKYNLQ